MSGVECVCDVCEQPYAPWFASNAVWNYVMGGPDAQGDPGGMLCPRCFALRAEGCYAFAPVWHLTIADTTAHRWGAAS